MLFNILGETVKNKKNRMNQNNKRPIVEYEIIDFPTQDQSFGSYKGRYAKEAAQKAFVFLSNLVGQDIDQEGSFLVFVIKNKENQKTHKFIGTRIELENYVKNNNQKSVKYKNIISKYNPMLDNIKPTKIIK